MAVLDCHIGCLLVYVYHLFNSLHIRVDWTEEAKVPNFYGQELIILYNE